MNILHLNHTGSYVGGAQGYISDVSVNLQKAGHNSHLVYLSPKHPGDLLPGTTYAPLPRWPEPPLATIRVLERVFSEFTPDVVYVHAVHHPTLVQWVAGRVPTVAYVHAPYPVCPGSGQYLHKSAQVCPRTAGLTCLIKAQSERCCWGRNPVKHVRLLRRSRAFVAAYREVKVILVGSTFMRLLLERGGIPVDQISILAPVLIQTPLPALPAFSDSKTILFAARLVPEKGLRSCIQALAAIDTDWRLAVAGDGEEREPCQQLAMQLGVADRIRFLGWIDGSEMAVQLKASACVAVPSLWPEPFGRIGPEAFTYGRPVVAFAVGGIPDWLEHGRSGFLVPPGDTAQLGHFLRTLLESPDLCQQMGQYARQRAAAAWNAHDHVDQLLSVFNHIQPTAHRRSAGPNRSDSQRIEQPA